MPQRTNNSTGVLFRSEDARDSASLIAEFLNRSSNVHWLKVRYDGLIVAYNESIRRTFGPESLDAARIWPLLTECDSARLRQAVEAREMEPPSDGYRFNFLNRDQMPFTLQCYIDFQPEWFVLIGEPIREHEMQLQQELITLNNRLAVELRENDRQNKALRQTKAELQQALLDLVRSQRHLTNLQEVIPICMICGKVKNSESRWEDVLVYFQRNNLSLSHGYCPECCEKELAKVDR